MLPIAIEIIALSQITGDNELLLDGLLWRMADCSALGEADVAIKCSGEYTRLVEQFGSPWHRYMALGAEYYQVSCSGQFEAAAELSERVRTLGLRMGEAVAEGFYQVRGLFLSYHRSLPPPHPCSAPDSVPEAYRVFWALPAALSGKPERARGLLHMLLASDLETVLLDGVRQPTLAIMGQVAVLLDERAAIERLYGLLLTAAGQHLNLQAWVYLGPVSYYLGLMAAALADEAGAHEHLEHAVRETAAVPTFHAYAQFEYGRWLARSIPSETRGRELLLAAQAIASMLGMAALLRQATAALAERA
jgi:hypothetical protein